MRTALAVAAAIGALPHGALFVPGRSLAGVRLGEPAAQVRASLGPHGVCESCTTATWYFTYAKFTQPGLAVEVRAGRVAAAYTIWQPQGWHTPSGLRLGAVEGQVTKLGGQLTPIECPGYSALVRDVGAVRTAYYVVGGKLWGFGLVPAGTNPCR
jgi:hypothetical protein